MLSENGSPDGGSEMASDMATKGSGVAPRTRKMDDRGELEARAGRLPLARGKRGHGMFKLIRALVAVALASVLLASASAQAASPNGGALSKSKRTLTWSGQVYNYAIPYPDASLFCLDGQCDHFKLKINMGQGA